MIQRCLCSQEHVCLTRLRRASCLVSFETVGGFGVLKACYISSASGLELSLFMQRNDDDAVGGMHQCQIHRPRQCALAMHTQFHAQISSFTGLGSEYVSLGLTGVAGSTDLSSFISHPHYISEYRYIIVTCLKRAMDRLPISASQVLFFEY